jgi:hypothetical protein
METQKFRSKAERRSLSQQGLRRYRRTRASGARRQLEKNIPTIARYQEVAQQHRIGTPIALLMSLPCCVTTDGWLCGRGTTLAVALPKRDMTWRLMPICEACIREISMTYSDRARYR